MLWNWCVALCFPLLKGVMVVVVVVVATQWWSAGGVLWCVGWWWGEEEGSWGGMVHHLCVVRHLLYVKYTSQSTERGACCDLCAPCWVGCMGGTLDPDVLVYLDRASLVTESL